MTELPESITGHSEFQAANKEQKRFGTDARHQQASYKLNIKMLIISTAVSAIVGGLLLYGMEADAEGDEGLVKFIAGDVVQSLLVGLQAIALGIAGYAGFFLGRHNPKDAWIRSRIKAEDYRLRRAKCVLELSHAVNEDTFRTAGAWFSEFVERQDNHLKTSAALRANSSRSYVVVGGVLAGAVALAGGLAGLQLKFVAVLIAMLGVCAPALVSAINSWAAASADDARADLHNHSLTLLRDVSASETVFKKAIEDHDLPGALAYADRVFEVLRADHRGFAEIHSRSAQTP